ncbi:MAG: hypothetical protein LYZ70_05290 [Nitrososphaerales archaeon]|nr:hypothetical protein [Nitrososphaerales archaeon]
MRNSVPARATPQTPAEEEQFKALVVATILDSRTEEALVMLCRHYRVSVPKLGVGVLEGRTKGVAAVYSLQKKEILAAKREYLYDPFVMVHEFYHHLRSVSGKHRGTERQADAFANEFVESYKKAAAKANALRQMGWSLTGTAAKKGGG